MIGFHTFIISTFPLAVPLEWNVLFMYIAAFLFLGYPAHERLRPRRTWTRRCWRSPSAALLFFPVLGELRPRPRLVPARRCASTRATGRSAMWAFAPGARGEAQRAHRQAGADAEGPARRHLRRGRGRGDHAPVPRLARDAQPGPRAELGDDEPARRRHRRLHAARGRVLLQRDPRLQLRRRPPAQRDAHRGDPEALQLRARASSSSSGPSPSRSAAAASSTGCMDAAVGVVERGSWAVTDAVERAAVAAQRPDRARRCVALPDTTRQPRTASRRSSRRHDRARSSSAAGPTGSLPRSPSPPRAST